MNKIFKKSFVTLFVLAFMFGGVLSSVKKAEATTAILSFPGIISVAGPVMNIVIALFCLVLGILITGNLNLFSLSIPEVLDLNIGLAIISIGFLINAWLALFNMIPFWLFDGAKVFRWNKLVYFSVLLVSVALVFFV